MSLKGDLAYLRSIRVYIGLTMLVFTATVVMGYLASAVDSELAATWLEELEMLKWLMNLHPILIMLAIFFKNLLACAMSVLLGIGLGLVPLMVLVTNGFMIGVVSHSVIQKQGILFLLAGILPHGVIELPIVLLSVAVGLRLGYLLALALMGKKADLAGETRIALHLLVRCFAPLLFLAAAIETFITPLAISVVA